jgi:murein L,D-transpeptidase YcbB/YkuD
MRDRSKDRKGFDRVLMAVAATFLTVSATSALTTSVLATPALGQSDTPRASAAELAIDAAIPRPEPANVPPPTAADFKTDTTATVPDATKAAETPNAAEPTTTVKAAEPQLELKPAEIVTAPAAEPKPIETPKSDSATAAPEPAPATAAAPAAEPVKAARNLPVEDQPVADKLRETLASKTLRTFDRKNERSAVEKFYSTREYAPVFTKAGKLTDSAKGVIARLKDAASDGLNSTDYPVPDFVAATSPDALADAELKLAASMLDYARHAQSGRMHWSQASAGILYPEHPIDPTEVLANVSSAKDASAALDSYNPPQLYKELKAKLAELRGLTNGPAVQIEEGPALAFKAGTKKQPAVAPEDPRVPQLRAKFGVENPDDAHYDAKVAEAVRKFQEGAEVKPTGVLDDRTVRAINSPKRDRQIDTVIVNMERWRWLPRQLGAPSLGNAYVILNIPDYTLKVMQNGAQVWSTRVVTGKPGAHATPLLTETMKYITVNPTWNVPPSIVYNEYLPALQRDPDRVAAHGTTARAEPRRLDPHLAAAGRSQRARPHPLQLPEQVPGLLSTTPGQEPVRQGRARLQPWLHAGAESDQYASVLLGITMPNERYTPEQIRSMYGHSEIDLKFPTPIPVNITYQTAFVDDAGKLQFRKDVYGRDATMLSLLKNSRGKDLENLVAHSQPSYGGGSRPTLPAGVNFASDNSFSSGPSFFERLFGAPPVPPAPVGRRSVPQQPRRVFTR